MTVRDFVEIQIRPQPLQTSPCIHKGGHPSQSYSLNGFAKDGLPCICVCVTALAVVGVSFALSAKSTMLSVG